MFPRIAVILGVLIAQPSAARAAGSPADAIQPNSVWEDGHGVTLTILERNGSTFHAHLESYNSVRELTGTVKDDKISWLAKDVRAIRGGPGGDNFGTITDGKIDLTWRDAKGGSGKFSLIRQPSTARAAGSPADAMAGIDGKVYYLGVALNQEGAAGGWVQVGAPGDWKLTIAGTILHGNLYTVESSGNLYVTQPATGKWRQIGKTEFADTRFMIASGEDLYTIETSGNLYRVNPNDETWVQLGVAGDWGPIVRGSRVGPLVLTKVSKQLAAVTEKADFWSALDLGHRGSQYDIHILGWSSSPGKPYYVADGATRQQLCLESDGPPLLVEQNGAWFPARRIIANGDPGKVHLLGATAII